ncbi:Lon protease C-terminal proteolytic domain-domain-containing protein [Naematelia encephala]|uniref:Lon protease homolog, mitochondrial n=1 Tax=Naematelia encephala TaxID=71784 RepID=A0A1Y2AT41_9TREE|nr:Lon protease C-terminal proteolytic domain-domain-containing protein [Naematelia encephala]
MLPIRTSIRYAARGRCRPTLTSTLSSLSSIPSSTRPISTYLHDSFRRSLHTSARNLKEKRWVNATDEDVTEGSTKKETTTTQEGVNEKAEEKPVDSSEQAESSKAAEERAKAEVATKQAETVNASSSSSSSSTPPSSGSSAPPQTPPAPPNSPPEGTGREIAKLSVPDVYPQLLVLPIARRPLFPTFYKAVTVTSPPVIKAIRELQAHGQPYVGAFLLKDADADADAITSLDQVHPVGVFAQITSSFESAERKKGENGGGADRPPALTVVLYPHRRIRVEELVTKGGSSAVPMARVVEEVQKQETEDEGDVASFERETPSLQEVQEDLGVVTTTPTSDGSGQTPPRPLSQIGFLYPFLPDISLVNVENVQFEPYKKDSQMVRAIMSELISVFKDIAQLSQIFRDQIASFTMSISTTNVFDEPERLADFAAAVSTGDTLELQAVLDSQTIEDKLQKALIILKKELINAQLQQKISKDVDTKLQKRHKEFYLMEQLKGIKKELGMESDGKDKLVEKFKEKAEQLAMPEGVRKVFDEEISKLQGLEQVSSEFNVTRNYLDWLTQIPWGVHSPENFNITHATQVLEEDHYGLKDVKDRILEFLAVGKLRGTVEGKIICLVGPPGVGKTSIGKSIARALGRQFYRFSVGGLGDVAEIKGHRRTYIGAMPGKPIQALKKVGVENPVILIDEIDKIAPGRGHNGDPSSALLEMLDPEQNSSFLDHYMDVPVDLSRILFVCTANMLDTIPGPLLDRMEVLEVSGYVSAEKMNIAEKYLSLQAKEASGLQDVDVQLDSSAIENLIRYYCRESGVRNLKKQIEKIYRKAAFKIVTDLGEAGLPEPEQPKAEDSEVRTVDAQDPDVKPASERMPADETAGSSQPAVPPSEKAVTTKARQALKVPDGVHVRVTSENLKDYVGPPIYHKDRLYTSAPPAGVSTGLGYLGNGSGAVMPIEVTSMPGKGGLQLTGKLGEVIRESAQIALSWVKSNAFLLGVTKSEADMMLNDRDLHLHMPEGAIGKEGPSAGTAILTALVSLFTKTKVDPDVAMTGEISLLGQVLPVGGLKEKILAAHRAGIKKLIVPVACKSDIDENVPDSVKEGIEFVFVDEVRQVLHEVFRGTEAEERWKETLPVQQQPQREIIQATTIRS